MNWKQSWLLFVLAAVLGGCTRKNEPQVEGEPPKTDVAAAIDGAGVATPAATLPDWVHLDSQKCAACHEAIVREWASSMHARSTLGVNPLYDLMYQKARNADPALENKCRRCHYPAWWRDAATAGVAVEGVSCVVCHKISPKHPEPMADGAVATWAQSVEGRSDSMGLCLSCHDKLANKEGQPVCTTGPEAMATNVSSCSECHMPGLDGAGTAGVEAAMHASHVFPGGHVGELVQQAASIAIERQGDALVVTVVPVDAGHAVPTGNPMRFMAARVKAMGADGNVIWQNFEGDGPPLDHPEALFMRVFSDGEGNRPVPPFVSKGPGEDLRLQPEGRREMRYPVPSGAQRVEATLEYGLAPAKLLAAANVPETWRAGVIVSEASLDLTQPAEPADGPAEAPVEGATP